MARQDSFQGSIPLIILKCLPAAARSMATARRFTPSRSRKDVLNVEEGSLYPALHRMEEAGLIKAKWITTENNRRARMYEITVNGRRELDAEESRWRAISTAIGRVLREA